MTSPLNKNGNHPPLPAHNLTTTDNDTASFIEWTLAIHDPVALCLSNENMYSTYSVCSCHDRNLAKTSRTIPKQVKEPKVNRQVVDIDDKASKKRIRRCLNLNSVVKIMTKTAWKSDKRMSYIPAFYNFADGGWKSDVTISEEQVMVTREIQKCSMNQDEIQEGADVRCSKISTYLSAMWTGK